LAAPRFQLRPSAYNGVSLLEFLMELHRERRRSMVLLWDGLPAHRSRRITDWIDARRSWLCVERLPGYAPELNPTEQVFGSLKSNELASLSSDTIGEVDGQNR
jgi:transposase